MASRFFSDHFAGDGVGRNAPDDVPDQNDVAVDGRFIRYKRCRLDTTTSTKSPAVPLGEQLRLLVLHSSMRPVALYLSTPGNFEATMDFDIGLRNPGQRNDGGVIDQSIFANNLAVDTERSRLETLIGSGSGLAPIDRGLQLWELVNVAQPGMYEADPLINIHLAVKINATGGAGDDLVMELYYT